MEFSIIIVNYNTVELTNDCLLSIFSNCEDSSFEIIVIDNNSQDNSVEILQRNFGDRIRLIENKDNMGFARANNQGAEIAQGKYLFFLNSDTKFINNVLPTMANIFASHPGFGILAPRLVLLDLSPQAGAHGLFPSLTTLISRQSTKNWKIVLGSSLWQSDWVSGAALIIRKEMFEKIGGWDEDFFLYFEDVDLCFRSHQQGTRIGICPQSTLIHHGGSSLKQNQKRKSYYYQSQNRFFRKHYGLLSTIIMRLVRCPYKLYSYWIRK